MRNSFRSAFHPHIMFYWLPKFLFRYKWHKKDIIIFTGSKRKKKNQHGHLKDR